MGSNNPFTCTETWDSNLNVFQKSHVTYFCWHITNHPDRSVTWHNTSPAIYNSLTYLQVAMGHGQDPYWYASTYTGLNILFLRHLKILIHISCCLQNIWGQSPDGKLPKEVWAASPFNGRMIQRFGSKDLMIACSCWNNGKHLVLCTLFLFLFLE